MEYIDLKVYFTKLLKNWVIIALCCIIGMSSAFVYSKLFATPLYSSSIKMSVSNTDWSQEVSYTDIETTLRLIENCLVVLEDDVTAEAVAQVVNDEMGTEYTAKQIKGCISYSHIGESGFLKIEARTADPKLSALICNAIIAKAPDIIVNSVANIQMRTLGEAKVNYSPVSPNTTKNVLLGFILGLVLSCGVIFLFVFFDKTISDEEKLKERYDLAVLGVVPNAGGHSRKYDFVS